MLRRNPTFTVKNQLPTPSLNFELEFAELPSMQSNHSVTSAQTASTSVTFLTPPKTNMKDIKAKANLSAKLRAELLSTLQARFEKTPNRHQALRWEEVKARLEAKPQSLW